MRMEKPEQIFKLALMMQSSAEGITLQDIENECNVSRRTAERMRDVLISLFPQIEEIRQEDKFKHWKLPSGSLNRMIHISAEELAEMKTAIEILKKDNLLTCAGHLEMLWLKIKSHIKQDDVCRIETDLEALLEAEGYAMRPGPRPKINSATLTVLREAVKGCHKVRLTYHGRIKNDLTNSVMPFFLRHD